MDPNELVGCSAQNLATYVDEVASEDWNGGPILAILEEQVVPRVRLIPLSSHPPASLRALPSVPCASACVSSLGNAEPIGSPSGRKGRVRVTVAVTHFSAFAIIRHEDGKVDRVSEVEGPMVELLRRWSRCSERPIAGVATGSGSN